MVFSILLLFYSLTVCALKHTRFRFYCVYLVPFLGPLTGLFLPFGHTISEKDVYVLCVVYLIPFLLLLRWKKKLLFVCLWGLWFFLCFLSVINWEYSYKASDTYPTHPHQNRLVCWEYLPPKTAATIKTNSVATDSFPMDRTARGVHVNGKPARLRDIMEPEKTQVDASAVEGKK